MENKGETTISFDEIANVISKSSLNRDILLFDSGFPGPRHDIMPIRFDALLLILCKNGEGRINIDLHEYHIRENSLIVIRPNSYISLLETSGKMTLSILVCSKNAIEEMLPRLTDLLPFMMAGQDDSVAHLSANEAKDLNMFLSFIKEKLAGKRTPFLRHKIFCTLQTIFYELFDRTATIEQLKPKTRKEEIMANFIMTVCKNFKENRQVSFYADQLYITPKHLSTVVKEISGKTAGEWIENYVIMEAKILLKTTDLTIQEISTKLNFKNQSFFGKYFRHIVGLSPSQFRTQNSV